ncbi:MULTISPECIES: DEAD/DEAH box helicase [unclassified Curtobacterium]|uniref:DEAD/DEAH box helicase n=1 Tax=unclassified Curtobacterium TaxID=257496 RepID=UPI000F486807|nr:MULTISPECIES: DEAD/DEAH box helicase [unclassified Curtobacterium]NQW89258.1 DEAD/DEAH box helicase [Curtobacterium sp. VKM Ac-2861]ROS34620.1 ATP-dependent RNA helicase HelY [Curtobacterium sp. PhB78]RPE83183.1 ATP-dependent RNA helicase HelY [Curtobacterium sp. PhB137]TCL80928.1 ATP-dependent RNA helicase HelY [Curtobacterium sp. PhB128]TCL99053.1 ATP-dependent RNA helicase HelY [Curtobacterium sp. PhB138]
MTGADLSAAERFAAAKVRNRSRNLELFRADLRFDLDPFQFAACDALDQGRSVLVAAPTGAGKTIVAEFAIWLAMRQPTAKVFYTTPMKALSNQKYAELVEVYGESEVGLLTGDTNVNPRARVVVMTTEVLRNMIYADSDLLDDLAWVVLDEVHYLADRFRGAVWEEVILHLPTEVRLVSLSATVSNAEEFGDWLQTVRGDTDVIVSEDRPVPLEQHVLVGSKMVDLFDSSGAAATNRVNPELLRMVGGASRSERHGGGHRGGRGRGGYHDRRGPRTEKLHRERIAHMLDERMLLPAIFFVFSRAGCDQGVRNVLRSGLSLTTVPERNEIRETAEYHCRTLPDEDLAVLGYWEFLEGLERGVAAHHAGMLPAFKEVVENLFQRKLLKVVFATETLALGVNMPARTVVLEKLEKFNGEARVPITPGEYTQLTGRAGRRGIDVEGHSVIQWTDGLDPQAVASLASRRTYPLNSSFKPTYNMAVNLIDQFGRQRTREVLETSFAQFQADRSVVDLARKVRSQQESLEGYREAMQCHLGDFTEYSTLRRELSDLERTNVPGGREASHGARQERQAAITAVRRQMQRHPCHACPDREAHARWAERWWKLKRVNDKLLQQIRSRTGAVATTFDRVTDVLLQLGYLVDAGNGEATVAAGGRRLQRIYGDRDLLVAECLEAGVWKDLTPAQLAAMAATIIYQPRRDDAPGTEHALPRGAFRPALDETLTIWSRLDDIERDARLAGSVPPTPAMAVGMFRWASGSALDDVLRTLDLPAGDFVRWSKQVIDLLDQIRNAGDDDLAQTARRATDAVRRGIVAYAAV